MVEMNYDQLLFNYYYQVLDIAIQVMAVFTILYMLLKKRIPNGRFWTFVVCVVITVCIARLPIIWKSWCDRSNYVHYFMLAVDGKEFSAHANEMLFAYITKAIASFTQRPYVYLTCISCIYIASYFFALKILAKRRGLWFLMIAVMTSMGFLSYIINAIRGGLAIALTMLAISLLYDKKYVLSAAIAICACNIHYSALLPIAAVIIGYFVKKPYLFMGLWALCFLISLGGDDNLTQSLSWYINDERNVYMRIPTDMIQEYYKAGFRWDFVIFSLVPIVAGFIYIKKYKDKLTPAYKALYNAYLIANAFWLLVIRVPFTDRFAYLSWFMMPLLLGLPLLQRNLRIKRAPVIASGILAFNILINWFIS